MGLFVLTYEFKWAACSYSCISNDIIILYRTVSQGQWLEKKNLNPFLTYFHFVSLLLFVPPQLTSQLKRSWGVRHMSMSGSCPASLLFPQPFPAAASHNASAPCSTSGWQTQTYHPLWKENKSIQGGCRSENVEMNCSGMAGARQDCAIHCKYK